MPQTAIYSPDAPDPIGPYSQAILAGDLLFVSGQIAIDKSTGNLLTEDIAVETNQVMINIESILRAASLNFSHVVKCTIFLRSMSDFPRVNEVYGRHFGENPPARETVEVSRLPKDVNVEISCIAVR
jgi:2-iminobutanoate/2-iminopropanoate deaminase